MMKNWLLNTSISFIMFGFLCSTTMAEEKTPYHYRTLSMKAEMTKQTKDFVIKNLSPFYFPDNLPGKPIVKEITGTLSTTTQARFDAKGNETTYSETLFSVNYSAKACPAPGEGIDGVGYFYKFPPIGLFAAIVKQVQGGTVTTPVHFKDPSGIPIPVTKKGCFFITFDGSDFAGKPYTMKADLQIKYTFEPRWARLDGEFLLGSGNKVTPTLNAYAVLPVTSKRPKGNVILPGTITAIRGNVASSAIAPDGKDRWSVRYVTAVYKKNTCQIAFKHHNPEKFFWNDFTGTAHQPNPSAALWPSSVILSDVNAEGVGRQSVMTNVRETKNFLVHVEEGDCVVQAAMPFGTHETLRGSGINSEYQVDVQYIPD